MIQLISFQPFPATENLNTLSDASYCQYDKIDPDTTLLNGYQSVINTWIDALKAKNIPLLTSTVVNQINWQNPNGKVTVTAENGKTFEADHVIVTVSLGNILLNFQDLNYNLHKASPQTPFFRFII